MSSSLLLLGSAARTVDAASASSENFLAVTPNTHALMVVIDHTASGGAISLTPKIQVKEPSGGAWVDYFVAAAALVATGHSIYLLLQRSDIVNGAAIPVAGGNLKEVLARPITGAEWRFLMMHGNANPQTYSVGAFWIYLL